MKEVIESTMACPRCGTLLFIECSKEFAKRNSEHSLLRCICQNCGYDAPVKYDSEKGWIEWKN